MGDRFEDTMKFKVETDKKYEASDILLSVYSALKEKGYNPINQIVGYILWETLPILQATTTQEA